MKTTALLSALFLTIGTAATAQTTASPVMPQDKTQSSLRLNPVTERADHLSNQMVRDLRLNGYQATRLRAINADKVAKMAAIERKNAGNAKLIDQECNGVCQERDKELQAVLSNDQYSNYFDARKRYYKYDKDFASVNAQTAFIKSVQDPSPVRANDAVIGPAKTQTNRPAGNLGKNAR